MSTMQDTASDLLVDDLLTAGDTLTAEQVTGLLLAAINWSVPAVYGPVCGRCWACHAAVDPGSRDCWRCGERPGDRPDRERVQ